MKKVLLYSGAIFFSLFVGWLVHAQSLPPSTVAAPPADVSVSDLLGQTMEVIKNFGGLSWVLRIAAIIAILISALKVTALNDLLWSHMGQFKAWAAPILGLIAGIAQLTTGDNHLTLAGVLAYVSAGAGAIILHELLDTVKAVPGIGSAWVQLINVVSSFLGRNKVEEKK